MATLTITLSDEQLDAVDKRAASAGTTSTEYARKLVLESVAEAEIGWEGREVLALFHGRVPGDSLGAQSLAVKWGTKPSASLWAGLDQLLAAGYTVQPDQSSVALAEKGYNALR